MPVALPPVLPLVELPPIGHPSGWEECAAWAATIQDHCARPVWRWIWDELEFGYNPVPGCSHNWTLAPKDVA